MTSVRQLTSTRIPTIDGEFRLLLYENDRDSKDHLALVYGDIRDEGVLVRVHSECFTGDVLGSLRCDCGEQLNTSMRMVADHGSGVILYLRQEGRGIGLLSKLRAYELQDEGFDTVEANLMLGHGADERDYTVGALILRDMGVRSVRLITNNPEKIESLEQSGLEVIERVPLQPQLNRYNSEYLRTKVERMQHLLDLEPPKDSRPDLRDSTLQTLQKRARAYSQQEGRPFVTLSYAQGLDGTIATRPNVPFPLGSRSVAFAEQLRTLHDALLVDIGTVLAAGSCLNGQFTKGKHPRLVVLDSLLRCPPDAQMLNNAQMLNTEWPPVIITSEEANVERMQRLEATGADVVRLPRNPEEEMDLSALLDLLGKREIHSVVVEGGRNLLMRFMARQLADHVIITMVPLFGGNLGQSYGDAAAGMGTGTASNSPQLENVRYHQLGEDLVIQGDPNWNS